VLAYKQKRNIVNRSYQTQADNIVGKMTMAALDLEMLSIEAGPSGPTRFETIFPVQRPARPNYFLPPGPSRLRLGFKGAGPLAVGLPPLPPRLTFTPSILEVPLNQQGLFRVHNGVGKEVVCEDSWVAKMAPLDLPPNAHFLTRVKIRKNPQDIRLFPQGVGRTSISVRPFSFFDPVMTVIVPAEVGVFFHFLDGPQGIKTARTEGDLDAILNTMNFVYQRSHAGLVFVKRGVNTALRVPGLDGGPFHAVRVHQHGGPDFDAILKNEKPDILYDVFFVGGIVDISDPARPDFKNI